MLDEAITRAALVLRARAVIDHQRSAWGRIHMVAAAAWPNPGGARIGAYARAAQYDGREVTRAALQGTYAKDGSSPWRRRHAHFPAPVVTLGMRPVWDWLAVDRWLAQPRKTGRPPRDVATSHPSAIAGH